MHPCIMSTLLTWCDIFRVRRRSPEFHVYPHKQSENTNLGYHISDTESQRLLAKQSVLWQVLIDVSKCLIVSVSGLLQLEHDCNRILRHYGKYLPKRPDETTQNTEYLQHKIQSICRLQTWGLDVVNLLQYVLYVMLGFYFDRDVTETPFPLKPHPAPRRRGSYLFLCTKRRLRMRQSATTSVYQVAMFD